jgi:hypothetical protein
MGGPEPWVNLNLEIIRQDFMMMNQSGTIHYLSEY